MFRYFISAVAATALFGAANADISNETISAYNTASQSADAATRITAAKTLAAEAIANPDNEQAALLAYEAAWQMCRSGDCKSAIAAAEFAAAQQGATHSEKVLLSFAQWKTKQNKKTRSMLDDALEAAVNEPPTSLTVSAFVERYVSDMQSGRQERASETAAAAASHLEPVKDQIGKVWASAAITAQAASFNHRQKPESLIKMAEIEAGLKLQRHITETKPDWLDDSYYTASAWRAAMGAYFDSVGKYEKDVARSDAIIDAAIADDTHTHESGGLHADKPPRCSGGITAPPEPKYPSRALNKGYVGAVLAEFDVGENGIENVRIAAAVPSPVFNDAILKAMNKVKWEWDETQEVEGCTKRIESMVYPFEFIIG